MQLVLGTAQWGEGYGITNQSGRIPDVQIQELMITAKSLGIDAVDTHWASSDAQGYGDAQVRLRQWARALSVTTKVYGADAGRGSISDQLRTSLKQLAVPSVHACLVHDWAALSEPQARRAADEILIARDDGLCRRIGVSAYEDVELVRAASLIDEMDCAQVPASPLDQRMLTGSGVQALADQGAEIQIRGIFSQGLLLPHDRETPFDNHPDIVNFYRQCLELSLQPLDVCLSFVRSIPWASRVVVGVTNAAQLQEIGQAWESMAAVVDWEQFASKDGRLIDPRCWSPLVR
jgi:aryl-alcohol dehydrogenase-like predicted oxidoreductase